MDDSARMAAIDLGLEPSLQIIQDESVRQNIVRRLTEVLVDHILGLELQGLSRQLLLTAALVRNHVPKFITFSGGVSEYIFDASTPVHGDIAKMLVLELVNQLKGRLNMPVIDSSERIRATVIGASQFTIQVSGNTIFLSDVHALPVRNVPVLRLDNPFTEVTEENELVQAMQRAAVRLGFTGHEKLALSLTWNCEPEHAHLLRLAKAIERFFSPSGVRAEPLFVLIEGDVAASIGRILRDELNVACPLVCVDGVTLKELDYVDLGQKIEPTGVVPVVIKSLLFG
jgi:ethanolamine utilization protein EutA